MTDNQYDICVLGGGPGGYVAAIRAAQQGASVALIETEKIGGTCLNRGCIPTKTYLKHSEVIHDLNRIDDFGIELEDYSINWNKMKSRKNKVVNKLTSGVSMLLKKNGVDLIRGTGKILDANRIKVTGENSTKITASKIIVATGSRPIIPNIDGIDHPGVITSREALDLSELPTSILVIGGGVIGTEMAAIFNSLGIKVTIVEIMDKILPNYSGDITKMLANSLKDRGVNILTGSKVISVFDDSNKPKVKIETGEDLEEITVDKVLASVGRKANFKGLEKMDFEFDNGFIKVNDFMETSYSNIYAIGDVVGGPLLAHVASAEGLVAADNALGKKEKMEYKVVPGCVYTIPEIASVGLKEDEAINQGYDINVGKFSYQANGKSLAAGSEEGFVKIVADKQWQQVLGVHIIGLHATELIAEAALAIRLEATVETLAETIHAHPTLSEATMEAAHDVYGMAIHK